MALLGARGTGGGVVVIPTQIIGINLAGVNAGRIEGRFASMDFSHGPGQAFGLLTFIGLVLLLDGYSNELFRRRRHRPDRARPSGSGAAMAAGKAEMALGALVLLVGLSGILVVGALSWRIR